MPFEKLALQFICMICKNVKWLPKNYAAFLNFVVTKNFGLLLNGIGYFWATSSKNNLATLAYLVVFGARVGIWQSTAGHIDCIIFSVGHIHF